MSIDIRVHSVGEYELLSDIGVSVNGWNIVVYKGFIWDGASIPRTLWDEIGCPLDFAEESLIHDALYASKLVSRKDADKIFHALLSRREDISQALAKAMYLGVRVGGERAYTDSPDIANMRNYVMITPVDFKM